MDLQCCVNKVIQLHMYIYIFFFVFFSIVVYLYHRILNRVPCANQFLFLAFNLDYYTEVLDLSYLLDHLASDPFFRHYRQLNEKLVQLIEDYSLVSFIPLNIQVQAYFFFFLSLFFGHAAQLVESPTRD